MQFSGGSLVESRTTTSARSMFRWWSLPFTLVFLIGTAVILDASPASEAGAPDGFRFDQPADDTPMGTTAPIDDTGAETYAETGEESNELGIDESEAQVESGPLATNLIDFEEQHGAQMSSELFRVECAGLTRSSISPPTFCDRASRRTVRRDPPSTLL